MDFDEDRIDALTDAWESLLGGIVKLLLRQGITIPMPLSVRDVPNLTRAAIARTVALLKEESPTRNMEAASITVIAVVKWLTVGELLENAHDDPALWRVLAIEGHRLEVEHFIREARDALNERDAQN
ncbi:hypothetical protein GCM10017673_38520 [Streptosporangium violaceochromogenes]|nr:hypothetical protein GCM10017673_38520 [Streptosporangium violaceochromogenes]